ncbi:MAG: acyltransferase family protein [Gemmatimonadales bacterium]|nr:acyltransferase family protein [Candidatus Palauibacter denitrificans]
MTGTRPQMRPQARPQKRPRGSLPRYHALDRLRASMMLLGVVRHAAVSYVPTVFFEWPYRDAQADMLSWWMIIFIRVFHLPVFFAIAGFFAAYLVETRGTREFLRHRWSRIGVPFLVAWPVLAVAMFFIVPFAAQFSATPPNAAYSLAELTSDRALDHLFMHLWFLYHLLILCVVASALRPLAARIPAGVRTRALDLFGRWVHRGGIAVLMLAAGLILYRMESWAIDYYAGPFPAPRQLALYGLFFGFGWLLFRRRETLEGFKRPTWVLLAAGILCFLAYRHFFDIGCPPRPDRTCAGAGEAQHLPAVVFLALSMWFMAYGLIGLFLRYMNKPSPRWRYIADASYWIYIVHVPFVMLLPLPLASVPLPGFLKLALVSVTAIGLILVTYRYFVRPTFIGKQLNGRRHPGGVT